MRPYALVEGDDPETDDVVLSQNETLRALVECLCDEPEWRGLLRVAAVELEAPVSPT
jgi:hypothetical protein